jgi:chromosome segregation ATPase
MRRYARTSGLVLVVIAGCQAGASAQDKSQQKSQDPPKVETVTAPPVLDDTLQRIMTDLADQINKLAGEVRLLRKQTERNAAMTEVMLQEERLIRIESKLDDATEHRTQLEAREQELQRRLRNIQQELVLRAGPILRRDEAEAAIRADIQRSIEDVRAQKEQAQQRIGELQTQAAGLRRRIEALLKKIDQMDAQQDAPEKVKDGNQAAIIDQLQ